MKRWLPIVAMALVVAGCDSSKDEPPATPQASSGASSAPATTDEKLVTGPRGPAESLPPVEVPKAPADSGRDSAATKPTEPLTKPEEKQSMPQAGQANNHSSEALSKPGAGAESASTQSGSPPNAASGSASSAANGSSQMAQAAPSGSGTAGAAAGAAPAAAAAGGSTQAGGAQPVSQEQALALMKKDNCSACHAVDKKLVGPSYKDVAAKYKDDPQAEAKLIEKVVKGGSGVWGPVPMPPHPTVPKDDIKTIVDWILAGAN